MNDKPICDNKWLLHCWGLPKLNPVITWSNPLTATLALVKLLGDTRYLLLSSWHGSWLSIHYPRLYSQKFYYSLQYIKSTLHCFRTLSVTEVLVTVLSAVYCILLGEERVTGHPCPCVRYQPCCMLYAVCCVLYGQCPQCCILLGEERVTGHSPPTSPRGIQLCPPPQQRGAQRLNRKEWRTKNLLFSAKLRC